jgi:hypothetical protein
MGKASRRKRTAPPASASTSASASETGPASTKARAITVYASATIPIVFFLILKCYALHPQRGDEGIYFYQAWRLAHGAHLYRDLFFAHPPLHLLLPTLLIRLFGYSFFACKALPQLAGAAQGLFAFLLARKIFGGRIAPTVALIALLFAEDFLKSTSYFTGINLADALLWGGVLLLFSRRPLAAGICAGASVMTLLQTAPTVFVVALATFLFDRATFKRFAIGAGATIVAGHAIGLLYGGGAFFDQVYFYHLHKVGSDDGGKMLGFLFADNLFLLVGGCLALSLSVTTIEPNQGVRRFLRGLAVAVLLQIVAMATRVRAFPFYFQPIFVPCALALGWATSAGVARFRAATSWSARAPGAGLAALVLIFPSLFHGSIIGFVSPIRAEQLRTYTQRYTWADAPLLGPLNGAVHSLLFGDGNREADTYHLAATEYLWNHSRAFDAYPEIVNAVVNYCPENSTVFGDSTSLPLVALGAHRAITADYADTNVQRFLSGATTPADAIAELESKGPPTVILNAGNGGIFSLPEFQEYLRAHYRQVAQFHDSHGPGYTLHVRM